MHEDKIIEFLRLCFNQAFPRFDIDGYLQCSGKTLSGNISNLSFEGTKFHFEFRNKKLLHFTNLNNLKSILESKSLWCSNFNKFNDKKEMLLAAENIFKITDLEKRKSKDGLFALSLTEMGDKDVIGNYKYHWERYGNEFKGAALELEIARYSAIYHPLSVQYIKNGEIEKEDIIVRMRQYYNDYFQDNSFNENLACFLYPLFCAFKVQEYDEEMEVRIFKLSPDLGNLPLRVGKGKDGKQFNINSDNEPVYYWNLPLVFPNDGDENAGYIRLNKIHIGKNALDCNSESNLTAELICIYIQKICNELGVILVTNL